MEHRKSIILVVIFMIAVFLCFLCFIVKIANHDCLGETCQICVQIIEYEKIIEEFGIACFVLGVLRQIFCWYILKINCLNREKKRVASLVNLKIEMLT